MTSNSIPAQRFFDQLFERLFSEIGANEQLLPGAGTQRYRFPTVGGWNGNTNNRRTSGITDLTNDARDNRSNVGVSDDEAFQHGAEAIDNAVLDLEFASHRAQSHEAI